MDELERLARDPQRRDLQAPETLRLAQPQRMALGHRRILRHEYRQDGLVLHRRLHVGQTFQLVRIGAPCCQEQIHEQNRDHAGVTRQQNEGVLRNAAARRR
jgi:hypothetical protein